MGDNDIQSINHYQEDDSTLEWPTSDAWGVMGAFVVLLRLLYGVTYTIMSLCTLHPFNFIIKFVR